MKALHMGLPNNTQTIVMDRKGAILGSMEARNLMGKEGSLDAKGAAWIEFTMDVQTAMMAEVRTSIEDRMA